MGIPVSEHLAHEEATIMATCQWESKKYDVQCDRTIIDEQSDFCAFHNDIETDDLMVVLSALQKCYGNMPGMVITAIQTMPYGYRFVIDVLKDENSVGTS